MPYSPFLRTLARNRTLAAGGGFLLARAALAGNLFAQLGALWTLGAYQEAKQDKATMAARLAAIQVGKTDPACRDPRSPKCLDHAKAAAVQAGTAAMSKPGKLRKVGAWLFVAGALACFAAGDGSSAAINAGLCIACAWPWIRALRPD